MLFPLYDENPHARFPWFTLLLICANVAVMWRVSHLGDLQQATVSMEYGFIPKRLSNVGDAQPLEVVLNVGNQPQPGARQVKQLVFKLSTDSEPVYRSLFSMAFLHGSWFHLISNMWMLWVFGNNVEDRLGRLVFLCFYVVGGVLAALCHWAVDPQSVTPVIGASGAVAAVLGGYAVTFPSAKVRTLVFIGFPFLFDLPALVVLGGWFLMQVAFGLNLLPGAVGQQVAFWAHIGGFVAGAVLMPVLAAGAAPPGANWRDELNEMFGADATDPRREIEAQRDAEAYRRQNRN